VRDDQRQDQAAQRDPGDGRVDAVDPAVGQRPGEEDEPKVQRQQSRARAEGAQTSELRDFGWHAGNYFITAVMTRR
jgi:hypothetical protein